MRKNYWVNSTLADRIRSLTGVEQKPNAATWDEWRRWEEENKHKIGFIITEQWFETLQDIVMFIPDKIKDIRIYIKNRFITKPHYLDTKLPRGQWYEFDQRVLYGLFEELVDFVEIEKANMQQISDQKFEQRQRRTSRRSRHDGLCYLDWEISLKKGEGKETDVILVKQAEAAEEIKSLYLWWKDQRPKRSDPYQVSGFADFKGDILSTNRSEEEENKVRLMLDHINQLEEQYYQEDEQMLIRLIKARGNCWT